MPGPDPVLSLLGLAARAGALVPGTERVRESAAAGGLRMAIVAADASANAHDKLIPLLRRREVPHVVQYDRATLGGAIGRAGVSAVGVTDRGLAQRCLALLGRTGGAEGARNDQAVMEPDRLRRRS